MKFAKTVIFEFHGHCSGTDCESFIRWWENYIIYSLFCTFIISSSIISICFVVFL